MFASISYAPMAIGRGNLCATDVWIPGAFGIRWRLHNTISLPLEERGQLARIALEQERQWNYEFAARFACFLRRAAFSDSRCRVRLQIGEEQTIRDRSPVQLGSTGFWQIRHLARCMILGGP